MTLSFPPPSLSVCSTEVLSELEPGHRHRKSTHKGPFCLTAEGKAAEHEWRGYSGNIL